MQVLLIQAVIFNLDLEMIQRFGLHANLGRIRHAHLCEAVIIRGPHHLQVLNLVLHDLRNFVDRGNNILRVFAIGFLGEGRSIEVVGARGCRIGVLGAMVAIVEFLQVIDVSLLVLRLEVYDPG